MSAASLSRRLQLHLNYCPPEGPEAEEYTKEIRFWSRLGNFFSSLLLLVAEEDKRGVQTYLNFNFVMF